MAEKTTETKKTPATKKTAAKTAEKKATVKKAEPVIKTVLQINGMELNLDALSTIAADTLKKYKSVHKRKVVEEFVVYVKPEENAVYYTVNGEGSDDFKVDLEL